MEIETIVNYGDNALVIGHHRSQALRVKLLGQDASALREGETIRLTWKPGDVHVINEAVAEIA